MPVFRYGSAQLALNFPGEIFVPNIFREGERRPSMALVENVPDVKDQGEFPACSAVAALSLYESWALRKRDARPNEPLSWAWVYIKGLESLARAEGARVKKQLLGGMPLEWAIGTLLEHGVVSANYFEDGNNPSSLREEIGALKISPVGRLKVPLRLLMIQPTRNAIFDAIWSQHLIAFSFAVDSTIDAWMHDKTLQDLSGYVCPAPPPGSPRLATHAVVIKGVDRRRDVVIVQNSYGSDFGLDGSFYVSFSALLSVSFSNLAFYILSQAA